jgi:hypothetical protein
MAKNVKKLTPEQKVNWRIDQQYFALPHPSRAVLPSVETYSAGWFAQGHQVLSLSIRSTLNLT